QAERVRVEGAQERLQAEDGRSRHGDVHVPVLARRQRLLARAVADRPAQEEVARLLTAIGRRSELGAPRRPAGAQAAATTGARLSGARGGAIVNRTLEGASRCAVCGL